MLQVEDVEKFLHALGFGSLDAFFRNQQAGSMFHSKRKDEDDERLVVFDFACEADVVTPPDPA